MGAVDESDSGPRDPPADELHIVAVIEFVQRLAPAAMEQPGHLLIRIGIATHQVARELEGRVLAGLIGAASHVAIENASRGRIEGLGRFHHGGGIKHLDLDLAIGHGLDVVDVFFGHLTRQGFLGKMGLDAQLGRLSGCDADHKGERTDRGCGDLQCFHVKPPEFDERPAEVSAAAKNMSFEPSNGIHTSQPVYGNSQIFEIL